MTAVVAGVLLGLAGSLHCVAMCGPLMLAARGRPGPGRGWSAWAVYQSGRLAVYLTLALAAGTAGGILATAGFGRALSVAAGVGMLLAAAPRVRSVGRRALPTPAWSRMAASLGSRIWQAGRERPMRTQLFAGVLNGLLPCGLVYTAVVAALAIGTLEGALLLMTAFGFGTLPALALVRMAASRAPIARRVAGPRVAQALLVVTGLLLIARGAVPVGTGAPGHDAHLPVVRAAVPYARPHH